MYKDDNMIGCCNDSLLRMMIEGRGNNSGSDNGCSRNNDYSRGNNYSRDNGCSCENDGCHNDNSTGSTWGLSDYPLASVFAPLQNFDNLYDTDMALKQGTAFAELDLPFMGDRRVTKGGNCRG